MYDLSLSILRMLHEDHVTTLGLLERMENALKRFPPDSCPNMDTEGVSLLVSDVIAVLENEVTHHFAFEEEHLFPRFAELADPGIPMMLKQEHDIIRPLADKLRTLAKEARGDGFTDVSWRQFHTLGLELVEREVFHVQKEEMGFLPYLDQVLDPEEDGELSMAYAELRGG